MHILYTHCREQNIHIYMYMGKPWEEMYLERDFQANGQGWSSEQVLQSDPGSIITYFHTFTLEF